MKITVVGTGYVGLVTGACLAEFGHHVICVDRDSEKIDALKQGIIPIYEPGLDSMVQQTVKVGRLHFTTQLAESVGSADAVFIAVGTPSCSEDNERADLTYVYEAAREIAHGLQGYTVVVTKSTVPVGTSHEIARIIAAANPQADFDVASNPEFLREGSAINDFLRPDRVVVGTDTSRVHDRARNVLLQLYRPLYLIEIPIIFTSIETAELIKYAANGFLSLKIAYINELADICEKTGADVQELAKAVGLDERIGRQFLHAGPGFGGSCFPKDIRALTYTARDCGVNPHITESIIATNDARKKAMAAKIIDAMGGDVQHKKIAVLGVTFKPNTDDMRDAPSLTILPLLQQAGAMICAYDPVGQKEAMKILPGVKWANSSYEAITGADATVILTEWNEFRALDFQQMEALMTHPLLIDLRNIYRLDEMAVSGFDYISIGRKAVYAGTMKRSLKVALK